MVVNQNRRWWSRLALLIAASMLAGCSWFNVDFGSRDQTANWDADKLYAEARLEMSNGAWVKARDDGGERVLLDAGAISEPCGAVRTRK